MQKPTNVAGTGSSAEAVRALGTELARRPPHLELSLVSLLLPLADLPSVELDRHLMLGDPVLSLLKQTLVSLYLF